jgi:5-enolpyruvylshikimate-3-phosphate synthase
MVARITPVRDVATENTEAVYLRMPPDKSILHRLLFLSSLTISAFQIPIASSSSISDDVIATVLALESLGVPVDVEQNRIELHGVGRRGYRAPTHAINCANSGTTARLLMG